MTQDPPFLTVPQVAQRLSDAGLSYSASTVQRWCRDQKIENVKLPGGQYRIRTSVVDAFIADPGTFPTEADVAGNGAA
jgi:excisionase family DNA binding protein